jgi:hypothetical protein
MQSGRNGGHFRPDTFQAYDFFKTRFGKDDALKLIDMEDVCYKLVEALVKDEGAELDFLSTDCLDVMLNDDVKAFAKNSVDAYKADGGQVRVDFVDDVEEAKKISGHDKVRRRSCKYSGLTPK